MLGRALIVAMLAVPTLALAQSPAKPGLAEPNTAEPSASCDPTNDVLCARPALPPPDVVSHGQIMMGITRPKPTDKVQPQDVPRLKTM